MDLYNNTFVILLDFDENQLISLREAQLRYKLSDEVHTNIKFCSNKQKFVDVHKWVHCPADCCKYV